MTKAIRSIPHRIRNWLDASREPGSKPRFQQIAEMLQMAGRGQYSPGEYWVYGFYKAGMDLSDMLPFMSSQRHLYEHLPHLNDAAGIPFLKNKWLFYLHFSGLGIPVPECYGVFDTTFGFKADGGALRSAGDLRTLIERRSIGSFVAKPVSGYQGRGVKLFTVVGDGEVSLRGSDTRLNVEELSSLLQEISASEQHGGTLIQQELVQHESLTKLSPTAAANLRVITLRRPNGSALVTSASMRIGRVGAVMSNASQGGLLARLEPDSGTITTVRDGMYIGSRFIDNHPDTGVRLVGKQIPCWDKVRTICLNGAQKVPGAASVGWDVIVTEDGPLLLEGNHDWDIISEQLFGSGYLTDANRELLKEHGLELPTNRLPRRFSFSNLLAFLKD